ncbi:MAG: sialidase family protein [Planctomycetota bacterium]
MPFPNPDSDDIPLELRPESLSRDGDTLTLLVYVCRDIPTTKDKKDNLDNLKEEYKYFVLTSNDLGKTWGEPAATSARHGFATIREQGVSNAKGKVFAAYETLLKTGGIIAVNKDRAITVLASEDQGVTWFNQHLFDEIGASNSVIGGDGQSVHIAFLKYSNETNEPHLVIRSFTAGDWPAPKEPLPAWLKEKKLPEPTREEF